jgi:uncharacterized protein (TIGR03437 family)
MSSFLKWNVFALLAYALPSLAQVPGYTISTAVGTGQCCGVDSPLSGQASKVAIPGPFGLAFDGGGNLYIAADGVIFEVTPAGAISTIAGGGVVGPTLGDGGPATKATLSQAIGIAVDGAGNVYVADSQNNRIRKISTGGTITTVAGPGSTSGILGDGGQATSATLSGPADVAVDSAGNIYVADTGHDRVRKISGDGTINTVAGNGSAFDPTFSGFTGDGGQATDAVIGEPEGIALDHGGNLYIADRYHSTVRRVSPTGIISTVAGTGTGSYSGDGGLGAIATLNLPQKVAVDAAGNVYIADEQNNRVRLVTPDGKIVTIAGDGSTASSGDGGPATSAGLGRPQGIAVGPGGKIYVSEGALSPYSSRVRVLTPTGSQVSPPPSIATAGVVSAGAFGGFKQVALGGWIEIYGSYLASDSRGWAGSDFNGPNAPTSLDNTSVTIGGQSAFVDYISPGQVNVQVPSNVGTGAQNVVVKTPAGESAPFTVTVNPEEPGLLAPASFVIKSIHYVAATFADGTFVLPVGAIPGLTTRPAQAGDTITLYGVGFGSVSGNIPAGQTVSGENSLALPIHVFFGSTEANVTYDGLAPGAIGLYQFNVVVPNEKFVNFTSLSFTLGGVPGLQLLDISVQ